MKQVTVSEFRLDTGAVYNSVQMNGRVVITHRDRPDMLLITQEHMSEIMARSYEQGKNSVK